MKNALWPLLFALAQTLVPNAEFDAPRTVNRPTAGGATNTLRIVTWNIDHGARLDQITAELHKSNCDVCALQEVDWNASRSGVKDIAAELADRLQMSFTYGIEFQELSQGSDSQPAFIGQATLSRLPIQNARILRFKRQSNFWHAHWWMPSKLPLMQRRNGSRIALVTEFRAAGQMIIVYNPHLESRSAGPIQFEQLDEMLADMNRYDAKAIVVIAGDINSKYFPSAYLRKLERAGFRSVLEKKIERSHVIAWALDWIFVRGPVRIEQGQVLRKVQGSDHYPIEGLLTIRLN